jgi:integrase/recombinase XerD
MKIEDLFLRVEVYVGLRRALGYVVRSEEKLLKDFVCFLDAQGANEPIRAQMALDWACLPSPHRGLGGQTSRLKVVRGFLSYLRASFPETEVPNSRMLSPVRHPKPYLYSSQEIERLMEVASLLRPEDSLRPNTYATMIGLLASTGLRIGEALRLTIQNVHLETDLSYLEILQTKFGKSRLVPLHATTADRLRLYVAERKRLYYDGLTDAFFVSEQGTYMHYRTVLRTFGTLIRDAGIPDDSSRGRPCMRGLRHTFAVRRLLDWYRSGMKVKELLPTLSVYMGHVQPAHTYWYLTATPELLAAAGEYFQNFTGQGGDQ